MVFNIHSHSVTKNAIYSPVNLNQINADFDYISLGIHPWRLKDILFEKHFLLLNELLNIHKNKLLAVGECGLDKTFEVSLDIQIEVFKRHIELSEKLKKPLIIHCVKAFNEIIELKKELNPTQKWIIHDFRKNETIATQLTKQGIYLSLSPSVFKVSKETLKQYPMHSILFETDDTPFDIKDVFLYFASVKDILPNDLSKTINHTTNKLFNLNYGN